MFVHCGWKGSPQPGFVSSLSVDGMVTGSVIVQLWGMVHLALARQGVGGGEQGEQEMVGLAVVVLVV